MIEPMSPRYSNSSGDFNDRQNNIEEKITREWFQLIFLMVVKNTETSQILMSTSTNT